MGSYGAWSDCTLSLSGTSAFKVRNRECSNRHCSSTVQEKEDCDHPLLTPGYIPIFLVLKVEKIF